MEVMAAPSRSRVSRSVPALLVLDEFPYLAQETPGLPSIVQSLYDSMGPGAGLSTAPFRLLLCGSAIAVMADLLSGTRALRGRAALELRLCRTRRFHRTPRSLASGSRGTCCVRPCRCSTRPAGSCTRTRASATPPRTVRYWRPWPQESHRRRRSAACSAARLPQWRTS
jgi:hypothetical protein